MQEALVRSLEAALASPSIPKDIVTTLLNLAEFMEHDEKSLPLDTRSAHVFAPNSPHAQTYAPTHQRRLSLLWDQRYDHESTGRRTPSLVVPRSYVSRRPCRGNGTSLNLEMRWRRWRSVGSGTSESGACRRGRYRLIRALRAQHVASDEGRRRCRVMCMRGRGESRGRRAERYCRGNRRTSRGRSLRWRCGRASGRR